MLEESYFKKTIVTCLYNSFGEDLKNDFVVNGLKGRNSKSSRGLDFLIKELERKNLLTCCMRKSGRDLPVVFDDITSTLYTFMKKERFYDVKRDKEKFLDPHYIRKFAKIFNEKIEPPQISLFGDGDYVDNCYSTDEVKKVLYDLGIESNDVEQYKIVLYETSGFEVINIEAIAIDFNMNIVIPSVSWNNYIEVKESTIMDTVDESKEPFNNPGYGIQLTEKSNMRKNKDNNLTELKDEEKDEEKK